MLPSLPLYECVCVKTLSLSLSLTSSLHSYLFPPFLQLYFFLAVSASLSMPECKVRITKEHLANTDVVLLVLLSHHPSLQLLLTPSLLSERERTCKNDKQGFQREEEGGRGGGGGGNPPLLTTSTTHSLHPSPACLSHARKCYSDQELHVHVPSQPVTPHFSLSL